MIYFIAYHKYITPTNVITAYTYEISHFNIYLSCCTFHNFTLFQVRYLGCSSSRLLQSKQSSIKHLRPKCSSKSNRGHWGLFLAHLTASPQRFLLLSFLHLSQFDRSVLSVHKVHVTLVYGRGSGYHDLEQLIKKLTSY